MLTTRTRPLIPLTACLVMALGPFAQITTAVADDEALSHCPPGSIFQKKNGNRGWCVETTPEMYGGGQAKDTEVLVPEESSGPSPFGDQKATGTDAASPTLTFPIQ